MYVGKFEYIGQLIKAFVSHNMTQQAPGKKPPLTAEKAFSALGI